MSAMRHLILRNPDRLGGRKRRICFSLPLGSLVGAALVAFAIGALAGDEETAPDSNTSEVRVDIPVIEGQDILGLRIPHHNENGELVLLITADVARRLDEKNVEMERMRIDFFNDERQRIEVAMPESQFNIDTRVLRGENGGVIRREDFTIEGQILEFDLADQVGRLQGEITMTIFANEETNP